jgi:nucleotide-binding universal stress UspA family protein
VAVASATLLALSLGACRRAPIIESRTYAKASGLFETVAIVPFYPAERLQRSLEPGGVSAAEAAELVSRFVAEAFVGRGVRVIPASDLVIAFEGSGMIVPRGDPLAVAALAAREFGASSIVLGTVSRYREREGEALGARRPASVAFEFTLYAAPQGARIWSARFDETQQFFSENPARMRQYPGRGSRFLTAAELARWGAERAVEAVPTVAR